MPRTIAIGEEFFEVLREKNYFYIDKTDFIRQWWDDGAKVTAIMRPRRFGKIKCIEGNIKQAKVAEEVGTSASYVSRVINGGDKVVNGTFIQIMEASGYDVELHYIKRSEEHYGRVL